MTSPEPTYRLAGSPFVLGLEVVLIHERDFGYPSEYVRSHVTTVYKNGNFRVRGFDRQFCPSRPNPPYENNWAASPPGGVGFGPRSRIHPLTPEWERKIAEYERLSEFNSLMSAIEQELARKRMGFECNVITQDQLDAARALVAALRAEHERASK